MSTAYFKHVVPSLLKEMLTVYTEKTIGDNTHSVFKINSLNF